MSLSVAEQLKSAREHRAGIRKAVEDLTKKMSSPEWSEDTDAPALAAEQRNWQAANSKVELLEVSLQALASPAHSDESLTPAPSFSIHSGAKDTEREARSRFRFVKAIGEQVKGKLSGLEKEMHQEGIREARSSQVPDIPDEYGPGFMVPSFLSHDRLTTERRDMVVGTATAGGNLVATNLGGLIPFLDPSIWVRALGAQYLSGLVGNLDLPRRTARATGAWAAEVDALTQSDPTFDKISLTPKRVGTYIESSVQLFVQSSESVDNLIREDLRQCISEAIEYAALNGSGSSNQPRGILNTTGIGSVVGGTDGAAPDWDDIVDLETALTVAKAARGSLAYYTTPGVAGKLKKTPRDPAGADYIWQGPAANGLGVLNGYAAVSGTLMPSTLDKGSSQDICHAIIFGNWNELIIAQWAGLYVVANPYTLDTNSEVRVSVTGWYDVAVRHPASFSAMKDALIS